MTTKILGCARQNVQAFEKKILATKAPLDQAYDAPKAPNS